MKLRPLSLQVRDVRPRLHAARGVSSRARGGGARARALRPSGMKRRAPPHLSLLAQVEHALLRAAMPLPALRGAVAALVLPAFAPRDARARLACRAPRPLVAFGWCVGLRDGPALRVFERPEDLDDELRLAARAFLDARVEAASRARGARRDEVTLPQWCQIYWNDFLYSPPFEDVARTLTGCPDAEGAICSTA